MSKGHQLTLDLPVRQALGRDDFMVTASNAAAVSLIDQWPQWTTYGAILVGPAGCGKSHLCEIFRQKSGARMVEAAHLTNEQVPGLADAGAVVIENCGQGIDQRAFFHLLNTVRQNGSHVLLTALSPPADWDLGLADLQTRLNSLPVVPILLPDEELLQAVLMKHFADRQLAVTPQVLSYLVARMPRSLADARLVASEIDRRALIEHVEITKPFVSSVLKELVNPGLTGQEE